MNKELNTYLIQELLSAVPQCTKCAYLALQFCTGDAPNGYSWGGLQHPFPKFVPKPYPQLHFGAWLTANCSFGRARDSFQTCGQDGWKIIHISAHWGHYDRRVPGDRTHGCVKHGTVSLYCSCVKHRTGGTGGTQGLMNVHRSTWVIKFYTS